MYSFMPPQRKSPRVQGYDYSQPGFYFVTICSRDRKCVFGTVGLEYVKLSELGALVSSCWSELPTWFPSVALYEYVVMPNHFHGIVEIIESKHALKDIVGSFKSAVTRRARERGLIEREDLWQRKYYDHVIRSERALTNIREYIRNNPIKWHLDELNPEREACKTGRRMASTLQ